MAERIYIYNLCAHLTDTSRIPIPLGLTRNNKSKTVPFVSVPERWQENCGKNGKGMYKQQQQHWRAKTIHNFYIVLFMIICFSI
jgi:hypothetical protein